MADEGELEVQIARLAAIPLRSRINRAEWLTKFGIIKVRHMMLASVDVDVEALDLELDIKRIGSFWHRDEEYHVYVSDSVIKIMIKNRTEFPGRDMLIATPMWIFYQDCDLARASSDAGIMTIAGKNMARFMDDEYKKGGSCQK